MSDASEDEEQREQEKLRGRERNLPDAEMACWREHLAGLVAASAIT